MKKFEILRVCFACVLFLGIFSMLPGCGGGAGGGHWDKPQSAPTITKYSLAGIPGTINEPAKSIAVVVPFGTNVTDMIASYTTTGVLVKVGSVTQTSGTTANNFTTPVLYTVTNDKGQTTNYTVHVTFAPNTAKAITAYSFVGFPGSPGAIDETAKTITVTLPFGTSVTNLIATFATTGTDVKVAAVTQASGTTANDFTAPVLYTVSADDGTTAVYTVSVTIAMNPAKAITAYSFIGFPSSPGSINESTRSITINLPFGTDVRALTANFTTTGTVVAIAGVRQTSGTTANDFTAPVLYTVSAEDGSTAVYTVNVILGPNPAKAITSYSFVGFPAYPGVINEPAKTIAVNLPFGANVTALTAAFTTTGTVVKVDTAVQTSTATVNNFTAPMIYTVTAADESTVTYTVNVTIAPNPAKAITSYSFVGFPAYPGVINEPAKTIAVNLPFGTNVTALTAVFTTTGTVVKVGTAVQTSASTQNNFTAPVVYTVTAADNTLATYTVNITIAPNPAKAITAYSFVGFSAFPGVVNEPAKTIAVNLPFGTDVTSLIPAFSTTGTGVKVGTAVQTSTATINNFTAPLAYTVSAADGTTATYTVTVTIAPNPAKAITAYSFVGFPAYPGVINEPAKTIAVNLPFGTNVTALTAAFTTTGTVVKVGTEVQTSTLTINSFTDPVQYTVTAADGSTATYTVTVTIAPNSEKAITAYSFNGFLTNPGTIDEAAKTIVVKLPSGTDVTNLTAAFTTTGTVVKVGTEVQTSTSTINSFTNPVQYTVTAADGTTATYTVTVILLPLEPVSIALGSVSTYGIMATSAITNTGFTIINGDVSLDPGTSMTGFPPGLVNGSIHINDTFSAQARIDLLTAYNFAKSLPPGITISAGADLGALYPTGIPPGTYTSGSTMLVSTPLTLDAGGDANAVWVFQIGSSFTTTASVSLANGAQAKNVFWVPTNDGTIGVGTIFYGTIVAGRSVTGTTGATINGRILAGATLPGTIALDSNTVNVPAP